VRETASGIAYLHANGCMHRDIKSSNILLDDQCHAKVADFGLAKNKPVEFSAVSLSSQHTGEEEDIAYMPMPSNTHFAGTPRFMAPEVAKLGAKYDLKCDVYSFGMLLWEVMHQARPFKELSSLQALHATGRGERPSIALPAQRASFGPLIDDCWAHEPCERPNMTCVLQRLFELEVGLDSQLLEPGAEAGASSLPVNALPKVSKRDDLSSLSTPLIGASSEYSAKVFGAEPCLAGQYGN